MIYNTKDLIDRALDLADCANTSFLSHREMERYLNEAYNEVYQMAINHGDDNFVKHLALNPRGRTRLPKDFYALRCVKDRNGYMYKRLSLDSTSNEPGYNIINNELVISGNGTATDVTYYPMPKHLTIQFDEKRLDFIDEKFTIWDLNNRYFVYYQEIEESEPPETVKMIKIYDMANDAFNQTEVDYIVSGILVSLSTFFVWGDDDHIHEYDLATGDQIDEWNPGLYPVKMKNGVVKFGRYNDETKEFYFEDNTYVLEFEDDVNIYSHIVASPAHFYYVDNNGTLYEYDRMKQDALVIDYNVNDRLLKYKEVDKEDGILYFKYCPMIFSRGFDRACVLDEIRQPIDCDFVRFYGFTDEYMIYSDGYNMYAKGNLPNVEMNYPNSTYFTLIAYIIATYLIAKQQGDVTILGAQKEKALQDFCDNMPDQYMNYRITNVY